MVELGMNHPGEIRTLVGIAEPDVRVWTNVGDAHLGLLRVRGRDRGRQGGDPGAGARRTTSSWPTPTIARDRGAHRRVRRPRRDVRHSTRRPTSGHRGRRIAGSTARPPTCRTPAGDDAARHAAARDRAICRTCSRRRPSPSSSTSRSTQIAARAATLQPARRRGELLRLPGGITLIDDSYNSSPAALMRALDTLRAATGSARKVAVLGEMLELGEHATRLHEECGAAAAAAGLDLLVAVGGAPARALADAARRAPACRRPPCIHVALERRRGRPRAAAGPSRRSRARQGLARHRHRRRRRAAEGGVRLMLYHLLYPLHTRVRGLQRDAVHHVPHRGGEPDGARHRACSSGR